MVATAAGATAIDHFEVKLGAIVGSGHFGVVHAASWRGSKVAVKVLRESLGQHEFAKAQADIVSELRTMSKVGAHPNVVELLGFCRLQYPPRLAVVTRFMRRGSLAQVFQRKKNLGMYKTNNAWLVCCSVVDSAVAAQAWCMWCKWLRKSQPVWPTCTPRMWCIVILRLGMCL